MKVVCIDNSRYTQLELNKVYEAKLIIFLQESEPPKPSEWKNNYLNIEGFSDIDWFETKFFLTIEDWRHKQLKKIL
jgi:hypothetical protein